MEEMNKLLAKRWVFGAPRLSYLAGISCSSVSKGSLCPAPGPTVTWAQPSRGLSVKLSFFRAQPQAASRAEPSQPLLTWFPQLPVPASLPAEGNLEIISEIGPGERGSFPTLKIPTEMRCPGAGTARSLPRRMQAVGPVPWGARGGHGEGPSAAAGAQRTTAWETGQQFCPRAGGVPGPRAAQPFSATPAGELPASGLSLCLTVAPPLMRRPRGQAAPSQRGCGAWLSPISAACPLKSAGGGCRRRGSPGLSECSFSCTAAAGPHSNWDTHPPTSSQSLAASLPSNGLALRENRTVGQPLVRCTQLCEDDGKPGPRRAGAWPGALQQGQGQRFLPRAPCTHGRDSRGNPLGVAQGAVRLTHGARR